MKFSNEEIVSIYLERMKILQEQIDNPENKNKKDIKRWVKMIKKSEKIVIKHLPKLI